MAHSGESYTKDSDYIHPRVLRRPEYSDNYNNKAFPNCREKNERGECAEYHGDVNRSEGGLRVSNYTEFRRDIGARLTFSADLIGKYAEGSSFAPAYMRMTLMETPAEWGFDGKGIRFSHRLKGFESRTVSRVYNIGTNLALSGDWGNGDWMWTINNNVGGYREHDTYENVVLIDQSKKAFAEGRYNPFEGVGFCRGCQ